MSLVCAILFAFPLFMDDPAGGRADARCPACRTAQPTACCHEDGCACPNDAGPSAQQVELHITVAEVPPGHCLSDCSPNRLRSSIVPDDTELRARLHELVGSDAAKILCSPVLRTHSGQTASIMVGGEFPIVVPGADDTYSVAFREYGTRVECKPTVLDGGAIRLELRPEVSELDYANGVVMRGFITPGIRQQRVDTTVELRSGESVLIGGIVRTGAAIAAPADALPIPPAGFVLVPSCRSQASQPPEQRELIILARADLASSPLRTTTDGAVTGDLLLAEHVVPTQSVGVDELRGVLDVVRRLDGDVVVDAEAGEVVIRMPLDSCAAVLPASYERDSDHPHPVTGSCRETASCRDLRCCRSNEATTEVDETATGRVLLGLGIHADAGLVGNIALDERPAAGCPDGCCRQAACDEACDETCRRLARSRRELSESNEADEDDDSDCSLEQFVQMQLEYLKQSFMARLEYEREIMQAQASGEIALARQQAEFARELADVRLAHRAELEKAHRAAWGAERAAVETEHARTIKHEHEIAGLRDQYAKEMYAQRLAAMEQELESLRQRAAAKLARTGSPSAAAASDDANATQATTAREPAPRPAETTPGGMTSRTWGPRRSEPQATDNVETVQFTLQSPEPHNALESDVDKLRRDVARLRSLVEDLLCSAPDAPPTPVPQYLPE
jgi:hypothetical protein